MVGEKAPCSISCPAGLGNQVELPLKKVSECIGDGKVIRGGGFDIREEQERALADGIAAGDIHLVFQYLHAIFERVATVQPGDIVLDLVRILATKRRRVVEGAE